MIQTMTVATVMRPWAVVPDRMIRISEIAKSTNMRSTTIAPISPSSSPMIAKM